MTGEGSDGAFCDETGYDLERRADSRGRLPTTAGNVRGTARALGMHRNQLRRWLEKHPGIATDAKRIVVAQRRFVKFRFQSSGGVAGPYLFLLGRSADAHANRAIGRAEDRGERIHLLDGLGPTARSLSTGVPSTVVAGR